MKTALTLALIMLLAGLLWKRRQRVGLALKVGAGMYGLLMVVRLFDMRDDSEQLVNLGIALGVLIAVWVLTRGVSAVIDRQRERR